MIFFLWSDMGIKRAFKRRNEILPNHRFCWVFPWELAPDLSSPDYVPSLQDIFILSKQRKVLWFAMTIDNVPFCLLMLAAKEPGDKSGSSASTQFPQYSPGVQFRIRPGWSWRTKRTNRLQESRNIFDTIVNNRIFKHLSDPIWTRWTLLKLKGQVRGYIQAPESRTWRRWGSTRQASQGPNDVEDVKKFLIYYFHLQKDGWEAPVPPSRRLLLTPTTLASSQGRSRTSYSRKI